MIEVTLNLKNNQPVLYIGIIVSVLPYGVTAVRHGFEGAQYFIGFLWVMTFFSFLGCCLLCFCNFKELRCRSDRCRKSFERSPRNLLQSKPQEMTASMRSARPSSLHGSASLDFRHEKSLVLNSQFQASIERQPSKKSVNSCTASVGGFTYGHAAEKTHSAGSQRSLVSNYSEKRRLCARHDLELRQREHLSNSRLGLIAQNNKYYPTTPQSEKLNRKISSSYDGKATTFNQVNTGYGPGLGTSPNINRVNQRASDAFSTPGGVYSYPVASPKNLAATSSSEMLHHPASSNIEKPWNITKINPNNSNLTKSSIQKTRSGEEACIIGSENPGLRFPLQVSNNNQYGVPKDQQSFVEFQQQPLRPAQGSNSQRNLPLSDLQNNNPGPTMFDTTNIIPPPNYSLLKTIALDQCNNSATEPLPPNYKIITGAGTKVAPQYLQSPGQLRSSTDKVQKSSLTSNPPNQYHHQTNLHEPKLNRYPISNSEFPENFTQSIQYSSNDAVTLPDNKDQMTDWRLGGLAQVHSIPAISDPKIDQQTQTQHQPQLYQHQYQEPNQTSYKQLPEQRLVGQPSGQCITPQQLQLPSQFHEQSCNCPETASNLPQLIMKPIQPANPSILNDNFDGSAHVVYLTTSNISTPLLSRRRTDVETNDEAVNIINNNNQQSEIAYNTNTINKNASNESTAERRKFVNPNSFDTKPVIRNEIDSDLETPLGRFAVTDHQYSDIQSRWCSQCQSSFRSVPSQNPGVFMMQFPRTGGKLNVIAGSYTLDACPLCSSKV